MMKKKNLLIILAVLFAVCSQAFSAEGKTKSHAIKMEKRNEGDTRFVPFMSYGIGGGNMLMIKDEEGFLPEHMAKMLFNINYDFTATTALSADVNLLLPDGMWGANFGVRQYLLPFSIAPFVGVGGGFHYIFDNEERDRSFGERYCASVTANAGMEFLRTERFRVRFRANYDFIINNEIYQGVGADLTFIYRLGNPKVRELVID